MVLLNVYLNWLAIRRRLIQCSKPSVYQARRSIGVSASWISTVDFDIAIYKLHFALQISIPMCIGIGTSDWEMHIYIQNVIS